ncbi:geraniol 8-hydroxylase-like [Iris pallida]|uniref:Geraniol 8-hydroxylase-like n=1 Tax=Iris pallida TaxID=29817 RepID=A0AAX6H366_IRIPA|nr:geraniol 8-hydroxylase-like [Iris pallida]
MASPFTRMLMSVSKKSSATAAATTSFPLFFSSCSFSFLSINSSKISWYLAKHFSDRRLFPCKSSHLSIGKKSETFGAPISTIVPLMRSLKP